MKFNPRKFRKHGKPRHEHTIPDAPAHDGAFIILSTAYEAIVSGYEETGLSREEALFCAFVASVKILCPMIQGQGVSLQEVKASLENCWKETEKP